MIRTSSETIKAESSLGSAETTSIPFAADTSGGLREAFCSIPEIVRSPSRAIAPWDYPRFRASVERRGCRDLQAARADRASAACPLVRAAVAGRNTMSKNILARSYCCQYGSTFWLKQDGAARILALSFVRKLVADLDADIQADTTLTDAQKDHVDIYTLHKYARSIVEQNRGTKEWAFEPYFRIIGQDWKLIVWDDVLLVTGQQDRATYSWRWPAPGLDDTRLS